MNKGSFSSPEDLFAKSIKKIENLVINDSNFSGNKLEIVPVLSEIFKWRDTHKEIVVQAVSIKNTIKKVVKPSYV